MLKRKSKLIIGHKIDLHTHSIASHDGGISLKSYQKALDKDILNYIAITDHGTIDFAKHAHQEIGDAIIIGQEIMTPVGEVIGLYLKDKILDKLPLEATIRMIKSQGGLVYIPHPLDRNRSGIGLENLELILKDVDIIEAYNSRELFSKFTKLQHLARFNDIAFTSSSDAHGSRALGMSYASLNQSPTVENLPNLLKQAFLYKKSATPLHRAYPKLNKLFLNKILK